MFMDIKNTIETVIITPETTSIENLAKGYIEDLAEALGDREKFNEYCSKTNCGDCKLHSSNYSEEWKFGSCGDNRVLIMALHEMYQACKGSNNQVKRTEKTCSSCKHLSDNGEFKYCTAWHNFTTETMYCGYYEELDNQQKK